MLKYYLDKTGKVIKSTLFPSSEFVDTEPRAGSLNPVTSEGVDSAIDAAKDEMQDKIDEVTLDPSAVALGNVHLLHEVTSFAADAKILVDSETKGPGAMSKDSLLEITSDFASIDIDKKVAELSVPSGTNSRMSFYYTPPEGENVFKLKKTIYPYDSFSVFASDSSGTNANYEFLSSVPFDTEIYIQLPEGYDRWLFYRANYVNTGIEVELLSPKKTVSSKVKRLDSVTLEGKTVLCFGDSITQYKYEGKGYSDHLAIMSGANVVNVGIGGTRYSLRDTPTEEPSTSTEAWACLDMYNLVHSWLNNDWDTVDAGAAWLAEHESRDIIGKIANVLKNTSIDDVDVVTLFAGTNDWSGGASKGAINDNDSSTLLGSISLIIEELLAAKKNLKIFVFTPTVRWLDYSGMATSDQNNFSDVKTSASRTLKEISSWIAEGVQSLHIPVCDLYNTLGWNQYNFSAYFLDTDGTHPFKGFDSIAKRMCGFMNANNW